MTSTVNTVHLVNAADDKYVPHVGAMLHSLFSHTAPELVHFHFLHDKAIAAEALTKLKQLCERHGAQFSAVEVCASELTGFPVSERFPVQAWYRVVLPDLLPALEKVLWLDADTLVLDDIKPLWDIDITGKPLAACPNPIMYDFKAIVEELGLGSRDHYFNSGVMLLNLALLRKEQYRSQLLAIGEQYFDYIRFADQDVLNIAYQHRYVRLPLWWNVLTHTYINTPETKRVFGRREYHQAKHQPKVLHFTGVTRYKPWSYVCGHPFQSHYLAHRAAAGWPLAKEDLILRAANSEFSNRIPLRLRFAMRSLRQKKWREALSFFLPW